MYDVPGDNKRNLAGDDKMRDDVRNTIKAQAEEHFNRTVLVRGSLMAAAIALDADSAKIVIDECEQYLTYTGISDAERKVAQIHLEVTTAYLELIEG